MTRPSAQRTRRPARMAVLLLAPAPLAACGTTVKQQGSAALTGGSSDLDGPGVTAQPGQPDPVGAGSVTSGTGATAAGNQQAPTPELQAEVLTGLLARAL
jgi:hypothetical protein